MQHTTTTTLKTINLFGNHHPISILSSKIKLWITCVKKTCVKNYKTCTKNTIRSEEQLTRMCFVNMDQRKDAHCKSISKTKLFCSALYRKENRKERSFGRNKSITTRESVHYPPYYTMQYSRNVDYNHCPGPYKSLPVYVYYPDRSKTVANCSVHHSCHHYSSCPDHW